MIGGYRDQAEADAGFARAVEWVRQAIPHAIAFAERDMAEVARSRAYWLGRYLETGHCPLGHDWRTHLDACGYCANTRAAAAALPAPAST